MMCLDISSMKVLPEGGCACVRGMCVRRCVVWSDLMWVQWPLFGPADLFEGPCASPPQGRSGEG